MHSIPMRSNKQNAGSFTYDICRSSYTNLKLFTCSNHETHLLPSMALCRFTASPYALWTRSKNWTQSRIAVRVRYVCWGSIESRGSGRGFGVLSGTPPSPSSVFSASESTQGLSGGWGPMYTDLAPHSSASENILNFEKTFSLTTQRPLQGPSIAAPNWSAAKITEIMKHSPAIAFNEATYGFHGSNLNSQSNTIIRVNFPDSTSKRSTKAFNMLQYCST